MLRTSGEKGDRAGGPRRHRPAHRTRHSRKFARDPSHWSPRPQPIISYYPTTEPPFPSVAHRWGASSAGRPNSLTHCLLPLVMIVITSRQVPHHQPTPRRHRIEMNRIVTSPSQLCHTLDAILQPCPHTRRRVASSPSTSQAHPGVPLGPA